MLLHSVRSAWIALRRRTVVLGTLGAVGAFTTLATVLRFTTATESATATQSGVPGPETVTVAALERADGLVSGLQPATTFLGIVAVALGAHALASDYQSGVIRTLLVRQPDRVVLLAGKLGALLGLLLGAAVVATAVTAAAAVLVAGGAGVSTSAWDVGQLVGAFGRTAAVLCGFGMLGAVLGLLLRSPVAAIGIGVGWVMAVEQILGGAVSALDDVLPGRLLTQVAEQTAGGGQAAGLVLWTVLGLALAITAVRVRDVTA